MLRGLLMAGAFVLSCSFLVAQSFHNQTNAQGISVSFGTPTYGNGVSFYDFNGDGWDDLTVATHGNGIYLYLNNEGDFDLLVILPNGSDAKAVVWADYDNDGDSDLFVTTYQSPCQLWIQNDLTFTNQIADSGIPVGLGASSFGAAAADYDLDGDVDLYVCNYDWVEGQTNWLLQNDGTGHFQEVAEDAGVDNGILPSFMPVWADFDHDGDPDLYVINDKVPPNALFENNGDGTFTDVSTSSGTDVVAEAMSNSIADVDGDGDLDIYVAQGFGGNFLLRNDGNFNFADITESSGLAIESFCWGALWNDYNNDRSQDLLVNTENPLDNVNHYFRNNGNGSFAPFNSVFVFPNTGATYSNARGDFDQNGFVDLVQTAAGGENLKLWMNTGNNKHWLGVRLESTVSNKDGIGVWIEVDADNNSSSYYTMSGEGYLGQASQHRIIGLNTSESIDLSIEWPSGWTDTYSDPVIDQYVTFTEGETYPVPLTITGSTNLCEGDSVIISAGNYGQYEWSTGEVTESIVVYDATEIQVTVLTEYGFMASSEVLSIQLSQGPTFTIEPIAPSCHDSADGSLLLSAESIQYFLVDGIQFTDIAANLGAGELELIIVNDWGCPYFETFFLNGPEPVSVSAEISEPLCFGSSDGMIEILAFGGSGDYQFSPAAEELQNVTAGTHLVTITDSNGCSLDTVFVVNEPDDITYDVNLVHAQGDQNGSAYVAVYGGTPPYTYVWSNGASTAFADDLAPGNYVLSVIDLHGCLVNIPITIDQLVGISEDNASFRVYPNPVDQMLYVNGVTGGEPFQLLDTTGRTIISGSLTVAGIDVSHLAPGRYILIVRNTPMSIMVE